MKKLFTVIILLLSAVGAMADNYFTAGVNDTLWVSPYELGLSYNMLLNAHFDGRLDYWRLRLDAPDGMQFYTTTLQPSMTVHYMNWHGSDTTYTAQIAYGQHLQDSIILSSYIPVLGYWDYNHDQILETYGTVKWEAGDYVPMFNAVYTISSDFTGGTLTIRGNLNSGNDARGGTIDPTYFERTVTVIVGLRRGDVNGDGHVSMDDLTALTNYLVYNNGLDAYQLEAADMNGNGTVDMDDLTILINYLVYNQGLSLDELDEVLNGGTQAL